MGFLGLRADSTSYFCTDCDANFCGHCQSSHAALHASKLVRWVNRRWSQSMATISEFSICSECSLDVRSRVECSVCSRAICVGCHGPPEKRLAWYDHQREHGKGNGYWNLVAPTRSVVPPTDHQCDCLQATGCVSHCERCFKRT